MNSEQGPQSQVTEGLAGQYTDFDFYSKGNGGSNGLEQIPDMISHEDGTAGVRVDCGVLGLTLGDQLGNLQQLR